VTAFASVVLDVDSTVSAIEGIDWLAAQRDPSIATRIATMTNDAMELRSTLGDVYAARLSLVRPTRAEIAMLAEAYIAAAVPDVRDSVRAWQAAGVRVVLVSGGLHDAILPLARWLGVAMRDVHAVHVTYDALGVVAAVAPAAPLAQSGGKPHVVRSLMLPRPILAVGDGATDAELSSVADVFCAFTGVVRRESVVARAAQEVSTFTALTSLILATHAH
jgi:phosphoserine phosphatase